MEIAISLFVEARKSLGGRTCTWGSPLFQDKPLVTIDCRVRTFISISWPTESLIDGMAFTIALLQADGIRLHAFLFHCLTAGQQHIYITESIVLPLRRIRVGQRITVLVVRALICIIFLRTVRSYTLFVSWFRWRYVRRVGVIVFFCKTT